MKIRIKIPKGFTDDIELDLTYAEDGDDLVAVEKGSETDEEDAEISSEEITNYRQVNEAACAISEYICGVTPVLGAYASEPVEVIPVGRND